MTAEDTKLDGQIDAYLAHLKVERNLADNTLTSYASDLADFAAMLIDDGVTCALGVQPPQITKWSRGLAEAGLARSSQARMVVAVRGFFRFLLRTRQREDDPAALIELPKAAKRLPKVVGYAEVVRMLVSNGANTRDRALIGLLYGAGLRVSEAVGLDVGSVYLEGGVIRVLGKGRKERVIPIGPEVIQLVERYLETDRPARLRGESNDALFPGRSGKRRITRQAIFGILKRLAREAGLQIDVSPHKLRHAFATDLIRGGADLRAVQEMLGHADLRTTEIYTHVDDKHLENAYRKTHPRS